MSQQNIKVARLCTGEIYVFKASDEEREDGTVFMQTPFVILGSQQGPVLMPVMPWATKGIDYHIPLRTADVMFYFPDEHCEPIKKSYIAQTSSLDLSALAGVSQLQRPR